MRLPDVPPLAEFVPGYEAALDGLGVPRDTPAEIVDRLAGEIEAVARRPRLKARLAELGATSMAMSRADFARLVADETAKWATVVKSARHQAGVIHGCRATWETLDRGLPLNLRDLSSPKDKNLDLNDPRVLAPTVFENRYNVTLLNLLFVEIKPDHKRRPRVVAFAGLLLNYPFEFFRNHVHTFGVI